MRQHNLNKCFITSLVAFTPLLFSSGATAAEASRPKPQGFNNQAIARPPQVTSARNTAIWAETTGNGLSTASASGSAEASGKKPAQPDKKLAAADNFSPFNTPVLSKLGEEMGAAGHVMASGLGSPNQNSAETKNNLPATAAAAAALKASAAEKSGPSLQGANMASSGSHTIAEPAEAAAAATAAAAAAASASTTTASVSVASVNGLSGTSLPSVGSSSSGGTLGTYNSIQIPSRSISSGTGTGSSSFNFEEPVNQITETARTVVTDVNSNLPSYWKSH